MTGVAAPMCPEALEARLEGHRAELTNHCRRMLRSASEAEDAVQETLVRAWRGIDRFEGRASLRSWLYRIATNVCIDQARAGQRRPDPMDLVRWEALDSARGSSGPAGADALWPAGPRSADRLDTADPGEAAVSREAVRLAFLAVLQCLTARERAALILCEVLRWRASEAADHLGTTVASVNSALQRARATLAVAGAAVAERPGPADQAQRRLLARYLDAFERHDVDTLVSLLR